MTDPTPDPDPDDRPVPPSRRLTPEEREELTAIRDREAVDRYAPPDGGEG